MNAGTIARSLLSRWPLAAALAVSLALGALAGCPRPQGKFDDFVNRVDALDMAMPIEDMALPPSMVYDVTGDFLLSISTTISPDTPIQFLCKSVLTRNMDGSGTLDINLQALHAMTRVPVGGKIDVKGIAVGPDGSFSVDLGQQMVVGEANPISGSDITAILKLDGTIRSVDRYCGPADGKVLMPIMSDLKGSKWGAIRVAPGATGNALPKPDWTCSMPGLDGGTAGDDAGSPPDGGASD